MLTCICTISISTTYIFDFIDIVNKYNLYAIFHDILGQVLCATYPMSALNDVNCFWLDMISFWKSV
jgi:hypothetical protein